MLLTLNKILLSGKLIHKLSILCSIRELSTKILSWYGTSSEFPIILTTYNIFLTFLKLFFKSLILSSKDNLVCTADGNISYKQSKYCAVATY